MTAINIKNLVEIVQRKVKGVSASTSIKDLENLMELTMLSGGGHLQADSAGYDSDVTDTPGRLLFVDSGGEGFFNFKQTVLSASPTVKPRRGPNRVRRFKYLARGKTYTSNPGGGAAASNQIGGDTKGYNLSVNTQSFPFASSTSGTTIIALANWANSTSSYEGANAHSTTHAYYGGGYNNPPGSVVGNVIQKFPFASEDAYSDVGDLTTSRVHVAGVSSTTHGYAAGGYPSSGGNVIDKYAFASDGDATDVGDLTQNPIFQNTGVQSETHGYSYSGPSSGHHVEKWSFASDGNATSVGNKYHNVATAGDNSQSPTHGYRIAGYNGGDNNSIEKTAYASDGNSTDVGDVTVARRMSDNASSTDGYIYTTGGRNPSPTNIMERTSYTVDGNSVDVGDLAVAASQSGGAQV